MSENEVSAPRLLVIGGTSSLAPQLFELANKENFDIYATYRDSVAVPKPSHIKWLYLDFSTPKSIDLFFLQIQGLNFARIIFLVGKSSGFKLENFSDEDFDSYFKTQLMQPIKVIDRLISFLESEKPANLIFVSSRSAIYGSYDWPYGVVKAGIQNFVISASRLIKYPKSVLSVASGLILGSTMQMEMNDEVIDSHRNRAHRNGFQLMTTKDFANEVWGLDPVTTLEMNGHVVELGAQY